jgi:GrpB-like predicted nucleotidyltransferase (UPF0157 family)
VAPDLLGVPVGPTAEARLLAVTVGELKPLVGQIRIVDYDPEWSGAFEREAAKIRSALGARMLLIEHVGSTSVPGLAAKPVIDVVVAVVDSSREESYVPALERAGYALVIREPDWYEHRVLKCQDPDLNLHVFSSGCPEIDRMLAFRDWLRGNPADQDLYARTKRELATRDWKYVQEYADAKTAVVEEILGRALPPSKAGAD